MTLRAIRGATQVDTDDAVSVVDATRDLLIAVLADNRLEPADVVFLLFTATPDIVSAFPAAAAGPAGLGDVPRLCAVEMDVEWGLPRTVRLVVFAEGDRPRSDVRHVYLGATSTLVTDRDPHHEPADTPSRVD